MPVAQALVAPMIINWGQADLGRPWFPFFLWVVALEWLLVLAVVWDLRGRSLTLADVGWPSISRRDVTILALVAGAFAAFVLSVGDSESARIVDGPWLLPRFTNEKLFMLVVAFTAGICEEILYRGYAFQTLRGLGIPKAGAVLVAIVSFTLIHGPNQETTLLLVRVGAAIVFFALYLWRGNLKAAIALHMLADAQLALST